jgi:hypothetical protein
MSVEHIARHKIVMTAGLHMLDDRPLDRAAQVDLWAAIVAMLQRLDVKDPADTSPTGPCKE